MSEVANSNETHWLEIEVAADLCSPGDWRVEVVDHHNDGAVSITIFCGFDAEKRARAYAATLEPSQDHPGTARLLINSSASEEVEENSRAAELHATLSGERT